MIRAKRMIALMVVVCLILSNSVCWFTVNAQENQVEPIIKVNQVTDITSETAILTGSVLYADNTNFKVCRLYYKEKTDTYWKVAKVYGDVEEIKQIKFYLSGLKPKTEYVYQIRCDTTINNEIVELPSEEISFTTRPVTPAKPCAMSKTSYSITLESVEGAVYRRATGGQEYTEWTTNTVYDGLTPNTLYRFQIMIPKADGVPESEISEGEISTYPLYHLSYDKNCEEVVEHLPQEKEVGYKERIAEESAPKRAGYDFAGWFVDEAGEIPFDFTSGIERDTTVYAKWNAKIFTTKNYAIEGTKNGQWYTSAVVITPVAPYDVIWNGEKWADSYTIYEGKNIQINFKLGITKNGIIEETTFMEKPLLLNIDTTKPIIDVIYGSENTWTVDADAKIQVRAQDSISEIAKVVYTIDHGDAITVNKNNFEVDYLPNGVYEVTFRAEDTAGNSSNEVTVQVKKDDVVPTIEVSGNPTQAVEEPINLTLYSDSANIGKKMYTVSKDGQEAVEITSIDEENPNKGSYVAKENGTYIFTVTTQAMQVATVEVVVDKIVKNVVSSGDAEGWDEIIDMIEKVSDHETITINMEQTTIIKKELLEAIQGRDITINFDFKHYSWLVHGTDISKDSIKNIDVAVLLNISGLPENFVDNSYQSGIEIPYISQFPFVASLRIKLGMKYANKKIECYYYNEETGIMNKVDSTLSTSIGIVDLRNNYTKKFMLIIPPAFDGTNGRWEHSAKGLRYEYPDSGYVSDKWERIDQKWYYFNASGYAQTGWLLYNSKWYFLADSAQMTTGWQMVSGVWYYMDKDGKMTTGWQKVSGVWYYMNKSGKMTTGWQKVGGVWYYMNKSGKMTTGWQKIGGVWYYMLGNGKMATGWQKVSGSWYYMLGSGKMAAGWQKVSGSWYYMLSSGKMSTGWQKVGKDWYYMLGNGMMTSNWQKINGDWYYMNASGVMQTGSVFIGGKRYYFEENGKLRN